MAKMLGWALRLTDGHIIVEIGQRVTEERLWQIALGWPTEEEIKWHKSQGARAFRCQLIEYPS